MDIFKKGEPKVSHLPPSFRGILYVYLIKCGKEVGKGETMSTSTVGNLG